MKTSLKYLLLLISFASLTMSGCQKDKYYTADFFVSNQTGSMIRIDYSVRTCYSGDCAPTNYSVDISDAQTQQLFLEDKIKDGAGPETLFYRLEIFRNNVKSTYDFWDTSSLLESFKDDRYTYRLTVDNTFF
ncbi:MAG: hypothetical protein V2A54_14330 [Bacteroidota bacterium]